MELFLYIKTPDTNSKKLKELKEVRSDVITLRHFELTFKVLLKTSGPLVKSFKEGMTVYALCRFRPLIKTF